MRNIGINPNIEQEKEVLDIIREGIISLVKDHNSDMIRKIVPAEIINELIIKKLENYIFKDCSKGFREMFDSDAGALKMCSKSFYSHDPIYSCLSCAMDPTCVMCEDCFLNSGHVDHKYSVTMCTLEGGCCDCGDAEAWRSLPICSNHDVNNSQEVFDQNFKTNISAIFKILLNYISQIGKIPIVDPFNLTQDPLQHYLVIFNDESHSFDDVIKLFTQTLGVTAEEAKDIAHVIDTKGFSTVSELTDLKDIEDLKSKIDNFEFDLPKDSLRTNILSIYQIAHMEIVSELMDWMRNMICKKWELCDIISEVIFKQTTLFEQYINAEAQLWKSYREGMIYKIIHCALYSDIGKIYLSDNFLLMLPDIYNNYIIDDHSKNFFLLNITVQFITCPSLLIRLTEHGLLFKIIDLLDQQLKKHNIVAGWKFSIDNDTNNNFSKKLSRIFYPNDALNECLCNKIPVSSWSPLFKESLFQATVRLFQLITYYNEVEPIQKVIDGDKEIDVNYRLTFLFVNSIHTIMSDFAQWIILEPSIMNRILSYMFDQFEKDFNSEFANIVDCKEVIKKIIHSFNVNQDSFSLFNFPVRFFIDILMEACIKDTLTESLKERIFKNDLIMLYIAQSSLKSLAFCAYYWIGQWRRNSDMLFHLYTSYRTTPYCHYLFEQDFNMIQFLMCIVEPSVFLDIISFPYPSGVIKVYESVEADKSSYQTHVYSYLIIMMLNATKCRHFIGNYPDPYYEHLQQEIIHHLFLGPFSKRNIYSKCMRYRIFYHIGNQEISDQFIEIFNKVSEFKSKNNVESKYILKHEYHKDVNPFYYHFDIVETSMSTKKYEEWREKDEYIPPINEFVPLRPIFNGINNFILSDEYRNFLFTILIELSKTVTVLMHSSICEICLYCIEVVLATIRQLPSSEQENHLKYYKEPQEILENKTFVEILNILSPDTSTMAFDILSTLCEVLEEEVDSKSSNEDDSFKKNAEEAKEKFFRLFQDNAAKFAQNNPDWLMYQNEIEIESAETNETLPSINSPAIQVYCIQCQLMTTLNMQLKQTNIFDSPSEYYFAARFKYSNRLWNDQQQEQKHYLYPIIEENEIKEKLFTSANVTSECIKDTSFYFTGCGHSIHTSCVSVSHMVNIHESSQFLFKSFRCLLCTTEDNTIMMFIPSIYILSQRKLSQCDFLEWFHQCRQQIPSETLDVLKSDNKEDDSLSKKVELALSVLFSSHETTNSKILVNPFLKMFKILKMESFEYVFPSLIHFTHNSVIYTLNCLDSLIFTQSSFSQLFNDRYSDSTNFKVSAQLSRLAYYGCGVSSLSANNDVKFVLTSYLKSSYSYHLNRFNLLLQLIQFSSSFSTDINFLQSLDLFSFFINTYFSLNFFNHLSSEEDQCFINIEDSLLRFFILFIFVFSITGHIETPNECDFDPSNHDLKKIGSLVKLFENETDLDDTKLSTIYQNFIHMLIPFIRRVCILYYQLFDKIPPSELINNSNLSRYEYANAMLKYLGIQLESFISSDAQMFQHFYSNLKADSSYHSTIIDFIGYTKYYQRSIKLVDLPVSYIHLVKELRTVLCPMCHERCKEAFKCLICGGWVITALTCKCLPKIISANSFQQHLLDCERYDCLFISFYPTNIYYVTWDYLSVLNFALYEDSYGISNLSSTSPCKLSITRYKELSLMYERDLLWSIPRIETINNYSI